MRVAFVSITVSILYILCIACLHACQVITPYLCIHLSGCYLWRRSVYLHVFLAYTTFSPSLTYKHISVRRLALY